MKKKHGLIALVSLLVLIGLAFWGLRQMQSRAFNQAFHTLNLTVIDDVPTIDAIGESKVNSSGNHRVLFLTQGIDKAGIHQHLEPYIDAAKPGKLGWLEQEWVVFYPKTVENTLKDVDSYDLMKRTYRTNGIAVVLEQEDFLETIHLNHQGNLITLNELVSDKEDFRDTLKSLLENINKDLTDFNQKILAPFEADDWSSIPFRIADHSLDIQGGSFSLNNFVHSLNPDYFSEETLEQYREEHEAVQAMLKASEKETTSDD